jgi:hypothetical protein
MKTVTYGAISITLKRATGRSDLKASIIQRKSSQDIAAGTWGIWEPFANNCAQVTEASGLPFDPLTLADAEPETVKAAYEAYLDLDKALLDRWSAARLAENAPIDALTGPEPLSEDADPNVLRGARKSRSSGG